MDRKKILVVDDDAGTRLTIRKFLEFSRVADFEVIEADGGKASLEALGTHGPFDLILLDIEMPDVDGFDVCRRVRETDRNVPIVFVTAYADLEHRIKGRTVGGDSFLAKPVRDAPLMSLVKLFLNASRSR